MTDIFGSGNRKDKWVKKATEWINYLFNHKSDTLVAGQNITLTPDATNHTVTIDSTASGGASSLADLTDTDIDNPTDGQALVYDSTNEEWVNANVGGTGNVDDVYVNGVSVLDEDKIAQVTSYKEVTQAEYDALPASKLTDGVLYCIKDSGSWGTDGVPMVHYDGNEKVVGTWFDETLYEKSYFIANPVSSNPGSGTPDFQMTTVQDLSLSNVDALVSINGSWTRHSDYSGNILEITYPINSWETASIFKSLVRVCSASSSQSDIGLSYCIYVGNYTVAKNLAVTIQYTKKS